METGTDGSQYAPDMDRRVPPDLHLSGGETFLPPVNLEPHMPGLNSGDSMPAEMSDSPCTTDRQYLPVTPMTPMEEQGTYCPSPDLNYQPSSVATSVVSEVSSVAEDTIIEDNVPNASSYGLAVRHTNTLSEPEEGSNLVHGRIKHQLGPLPQAKIGKPEVQCDRSRGERVAVQYRLPSYCTCSRHGFGVQYIVIDCSPFHLPLFLLPLSLRMQARQWRSTSKRVPWRKMVATTAWNLSCRSFALWSSSTANSAVGMVHSPVRGHIGTHFNQLL